MRVIGGDLKGRAIMPPAGYKARPTTDFAKEGLFNVLINEIDFEQSSLLDLFSGTGSISYEFASRGCRDIVAIEMNAVNAAFIKKTSAALGISDRIQVVHHNVFDFLPICHREFDVVFADPPYAINGLDTIPDKVFFNSVVAEGGLFILEHPAEYSFTGHPYFVKEKKYGNVHFTFFEKRQK